MDFTGSAVRIGTIIGVARSIWEWIAGIIDRRASNEIDMIAQRILRHFEQAQEKAIAGSIWYTIKDLKNHGIVTEDEDHKSKAQKALLKLCQDGKLEYSDGRYYLKGWVPPKQFNPYG